MKAGNVKRGLAMAILLVCVVVLPGRASSAGPAFTVAPVTVGESENATFTVTRADSSTEAINLIYSTIDGTATSPDDYSGATNVPVTVPADTQTKTFDIPVAGDELDEASETFSVSVRHESGEPATTVTATINDDQADEPPTVRIGDAGNVVEGAPASFPVTLSKVSGRDVQVSYQTFPSASADFTGTTNGSITIEKGQVTRPIIVQTTQDGLIEGDETFSVALNPCNATCSPGSPTQGSATIKDDEQGAKLSLESAAVAEGDAGTVDLIFIVKLSAASDRRVRVTADPSDGSAVAPADYQDNSELLTFQAGETQKPFVVKIKGDVLDESDETITVTLRDSENAEIAIPQATGTIRDDDRNSMLSIGDASADEPSSGTTTITFTVTLAPASARRVTVGYATMDGTAATGSDYATANGTLSFQPGQTSQPLTVTVLGDTINEDNETVLVNLVSASGAPIADAQGQGTIIDKNAPPSLSISDAVGREGGGASVTVQLAGTTLRTVTVTFSTNDGTAKEPGDYAARRGTLTFAPGEKEKTVDVTVVDDALAESVETFFIELGDPVNATMTKSRGTVAIQASDQVTPTSAPPPQTNPRRTTPPAPKALLPKMVLAPRIVTVTTRGLARLFLTCAKTSPITCSGSVTLQTTGKPAVKIGSKKFSVRKGKKQTLGVKLSPKARKLLAKRPTLRARVVVLVKTGKKSLRVVPGVITLKAAPKLAKPKAAKKSTAPKDTPPKVTVRP